MSKVIDTIISARSLMIVICVLLVVTTDFDIANDVSIQKQDDERLVIDAASNVNDERSRDIDESPEYRDVKAERNRPTTIDIGKLQNLRIVFLGDSVTRYQYLSLAYYIRYGYWYDTSVTTIKNNLMNAHSFHHPYHPNEDWNEFFIQSNRVLHPMEICDCIRSSGATTNTKNSTSSSSSSSNDILVERRYFYDEENNNILVYINMNGKETSAGGRGYYGRLRPERIFTANFSTMVDTIVPGMDEIYQSNSDRNKEYSDDNRNNISSDDNYSIQWEYHTWDDVVRYHVGLLDFNFNRLVQQAQPRAYVLLNAGLHPHDFHNNHTIENVVTALHDTQLHGTWKTTTYTKVHVHQEQRKRNGRIVTDDQVTIQDVQHNEKHNVTSTLVSDTYMCEALLHHCLNTSWIVRLRTPPPLSQYFVDNLHFKEPLYRIMNEEYLQQLQEYQCSLFPTPQHCDAATTTTMYVPYNRSKIIG